MFYRNTKIKVHSDYQQTRSLPLVLFFGVFCSIRTEEIIQDNGKRKGTSTYCVQYENEKKERIIIKFGRSFSCGYSAIFILYVYWTRSWRRWREYSIHTKKSICEWYSRKRREYGVVIVHRRPMVKSFRREIQLDMYIYVRACRHTKKSEEKKEKKKRGLHARIYSFMKKEKKRKRCSSFLLCTSSSTSKKPFLNLPLTIHKKRKRENKKCCLYINYERKKENESTRWERKSDHKNKTREDKTTNKNIYTVRRTKITVFLCRLDLWFENKFGKTPFSISLF